MPHFGKQLNRMPEWVQRRQHDQTNGAHLAVQHLPNVVVCAIQNTNRLPHLVLSRSLAVIPKGNLNGLKSTSFLRTNVHKAIERAKNVSTVESR